MPFDCPECGRSLPNFMYSGHQNVCDDCHTGKTFDLSDSPGSGYHYYTEVEPPDSAPKSTTAHVFAVDRYDQDNRKNDEYSQILHQYAKNSRVGYQEELAQALNNLYGMRFHQYQISFDRVTVFPRSIADAVSDELQELARGLTSKFDIEYSQLLRRTETTQKQKRLSRLDRWRNHQGTLTVTGSVANERIVLFDDICTSGASLAWGTKLLREAGASQVICISMGLSYKQRQPVETITHSSVTVGDLC